MTYEEYFEKLTALRKEYADSIRALVRNTADDRDLIFWASSQAEEYRLRVEALIEEYRA